MNGPAARSSSDSAIDLQQLVSPRLMQTRATLTAVETSTVGLSAGVQLAVAMVWCMREEQTLRVIGPPQVLVTVASVVGVVTALFAKIHQPGRSSKDQDPLWGSWWLFWVSLSLNSVLVLVTSVALLWSPQLAAYTAISSGVTAVPLLGCVALRGLAALDGRSRTPLADLSLSTGHCVLAGVAACLGLGILRGSITAELTYELGAGVAFVAFWTVASAAWVLWWSRALLLAERLAGRRWPTSRKSSNSALLIMLFGVLVPAVVVAVALTSARLSGVAPACLAIVLSLYGLRHVTVTMRYGPDPRILSLTDEPVWRNEDEEVVIE